tara:strand:- start:34977 stop:37049 length:2073 start_codon:yes stop_codon:yes gene_type:complete
MLAVPFMALLYFCFTIFAIAGQSTATGASLPTWFIWFRGATCLYFVYWTWRVRSYPFTDVSREHWIGVSTLLTVLNVTLSYYLIGSTWQAYHFIFLLVAMSLIVSSVRWFIGISVACYLGLGLASSSVLGSGVEAWRMVGELVTVGLCLSILLFATRRSSLMVLLSLTNEASRERDLAKGALAAAQRARADFQELIERAPDAFLILVDDSIQYANPAFLNSLRHSVDEVFGKLLSGFIIDGAIEYAGSSRITFRRSDGESVVVDFSQASNVTHDEQPATLLMGRDVTEADQDLHARLQLADRMSAIGVLATGVAHEINNPLAYVIGNLAILQDELEALEGSIDAEESRDMSELLEESLHGAKRVATIVRDLNSMARFERPNARANVNEVLQSSIRIAQPHLQHRSKVIIDIGDVPEVAVDPARLSQVFLNLIINAAHSFEDTEHVLGTSNRISIRCRLGENGQVTVEISDTGRGMNEETKRRLFEPFFTTKEVGQGTGLGLYYCMNEVSKCGGELNFESEVGKGTTFRISLPPFDDGKPEREEAKRSLHQTPDLTELSILIIDDEPLVCRTLKRMLGSGDVAIATNADDAMRQLSNEKFDVVFCDLMMPDRTGAELYAWAEEEDPGIGARFIFITGGAFTPESERFLAERSDQVVMKPFRRKTLEQAIAVLMERSASRPEAATTTQPVLH